MDWAQVVAWVIALLTSSGGVYTIYQARKQAEVGMSGVEVEARAAVTADWGALGTHWQAELVRLANELGEERAENRRLHEVIRVDNLHIDLLEAQVWTGCAPPPAKRPTA